MRLPDFLLVLACLGLTTPVVAEAQTRDSPGAPGGIPLDKRLHAFSAFWASGAGYAVAIESDAERDGRLAGALATGLGAGFAKEAYDYWVQDEPFSWSDLAADAVGTLLFIGLARTTGG